MHRKGCRLCLRSAKSTRWNPGSALPDSLSGVSIQQVAGRCRGGQLNAAFELE
jgi:hypothetical protein